MLEFFIKNNKFTYLFLVALLGVGTYSLLSIPKESAPEVVVPVGVVTTVYPGTPASDMELLVTNEIERGVTSLDNIKKITSTSREGISNVVVEFEASADLDVSIKDLRDEIDTIKQNLPKDAEDPAVSEVDFVNQPIMKIALSAGLSDFEYTALADDITSQLETVSGVSRVELQGVRSREVTIIVNQEALYRYHLTLNQVTTAIGNANITLPVGQIVNNGILYNVAFEGDIPDAIFIPDIGIATRNGQPIYIHDIATVEDGLAPATSLSRLSIQGQPSKNSISIDVYKQSGGDITKITDAVNKKVATLTKQGQLLEGIQTVTVLDAGKDIKGDLVRLSSSGLQTIILVVLLLIVTIGWREGLLAGLAIPLTFLFGFIGLYFSGNTINFLSLFALILGIGILVDSAIVMVEGINSKMKEDPTIDKKQAAIESIHEFAGPLISGTLTTVSMFIGLFIVSGVIGQFISSIPFTLIFLLFASLFVAIAIIPLLASVILRRRTTSTFEKKQLKYTHRLEHWYRRKLCIFITDVDTQHKFLASLFAGLVFSLSLAVNIFFGLVAAPLVYILALKTYHIQTQRSWSNIQRAFLWYPSMIIVVVATFFIVGKVLPSYNPVQVIFFAQSNVNYVIVEIENPQGTTKEVTDVGIRRVEELLYDEQDITSFTTTVGAGSQFASGEVGEKFANIFINLKLDRTRTSTEIVEYLRSKMSVLKDLKVTVTQPSDGPPTGAAVVVKFLGDDMSTLQHLSSRSSEILKSIPGAVNVNTSTHNNSTEFVLTLDRAKTTALGLNPLQVSQIARTAVYGTKATSLTTTDTDIDVVVKLNVNNSDTTTNDNINVTTINALGEITIPTQTGSVPLSSLVTTSLRESSAVIEHEGGSRVVTVTSDVSPTANSREIQAQAVQKIKENLTIPEGISLNTGGGENDDSNKAFIEMLLALVVGIVLMIGVLVLQFNSYLHTRYVLSILPYSLIGIMTGLAVTSNPLSFPSIMGFIALSGIVVNNSILLIDMMNTMRKKNPDKDITEIVLDASSNRLRPILLTTVTTVIGMVPLTMAGDLWAPLAYAVMFGLLFSVIITLILVPIMYSQKPGEIQV